MTEKVKLVKANVSFRFENEEYVREDGSTGIAEPAMIISTSDGGYCRLSMMDTKLLYKTLNARYDEVDECCKADVSALLEQLNS